jgi:hypothetical protein
MPSKSDIEFTRLGQTSEETDQVVANSRPKKKKFHCGYVGNCIVMNIPPDYKIVIGPHWPGVLVAEATIIGGSLLFLKLIELNSQFAKPSPYTPWLRYNVMFMFALTSLLLFAVALADPGLVPDLGGEDSPAAPADGISNSLADVDAEDGSSSATRRELIVNRERQATKRSDEPWCDICEVRQCKSMRISHCYDCNVCIEDIDHHCPWMGKCIGRGNMNVFILFNMCWILFLCELLGGVMFG